VSKPMWLKVDIASGEKLRTVEKQLQGSKLYTVCEEAKCPNIGECWNSGTATFMVLGRVCTRNCLFCGVESAKKGQALDKEEPANIGKAIKSFGLRYAVLTSVDRDDLPDLGAGHFSNCIKAVKKEGVRVEALIPDFQGRKTCLQKIVEAKPNVIGHNLEVVERLQGFARDARASYRRSLKVLENVKKLDGGIFTKSSLMLGLGEEREEIEQAMDDLRSVECDFLTLGQYLQPSKKNLPVIEFVEPKVFEELREIAKGKGFRKVVSGPLVRSSYKAGDLFEGSI